MSTESTSNLGLHQWVLDDPFLMEEMNGNFRKIDTAAGMQAMERLGSVTTSAMAAQIDLDLSEIDWSKYLAVEIFCDIACGPSSGANNLPGSPYIRPMVNDLDAGFYTASVGSNAVNSNVISLPLLAADGYLKAVIYGKRAGNPVIYFEACSFTSGYSYIKFSRLPLSSPEEIETFSMVGNDAGDRFKAGCTFTFWGIKR